MKRFTTRPVGLIGISSEMDYALALCWNVLEQDKLKPNSIFTVNDATKSWINARSDSSAALSAYSSYITVIDEKENKYQLTDKAIDICKKYLEKQG